METHNYGQKREQLSVLKFLHQMIKCFVAAEVEEKKMLSPVSELLLLSSSLCSDYQHESNILHPKYFSV
jgi:hypothetical protein